MKDGYRDTTTNWLGFVKQVRDGYERFMGVSHGVQKDAIQNGWDARIHKKGPEWGFEFELIVHNGRTLFTMTDSGTHGLTGRVLTNPKEYYEDMPGDLRWARFESLAFTKGSAEDLGSRGRGKFIFVAASKEHIIFYDTLLADGTYRLGTRIVTQTSSPVKHWGGDEAKAKLAELTNNLLKPLEKAGTRVIISEPVEELTEAVKTGEFEKYLSETWWEIIQKYNAKIYITVDGKRKRISLPSGFPPPEKDDKEKGIFTWIKEHEKIPGTSFKIKKMHIVCDKSGIDEMLSGISVQRGGMKVTSIEPKYIPKHIAENIYGYVTVDDNLEKEIRGSENDEHYQVSYTKKVLRCFRDYIINEISEFAGKKLGYGKDAREVKREMHRRAEQVATERFNQIAEDMGLRTTFPGKHGKKKGPIGPKEFKEIYISMSEPTFPDPTVRRVNYGDSLKNISVSAVNNSPDKIKVRLKLRVRFGGNLIREILEKDLEIKPGSSSKIFGPYEEKITKSAYPHKGKYSVSALLDSLERGKKGHKYDRRSKAFYVELTPPKGGIFEKCIPFELPEMPHLMGYAKTGESGGYILEYNMAHNEYLEIEDDEEKLAQHLFRIMAFEICKMDLVRESPVLFTKEESKETEKMLEAVFDKIGFFMHKYFTIQ